MLLKYFHSLRYVSIIAVVSSFIGSVLMFIIGAIKTYRAFTYYFSAKTPVSGFEDLTNVDLATSYLIKSVDAFLVGLVLLIFSYGVHSLFIRGTKVEESVVFDWLKISSVSHLKNILAEVIIVILFVKTLEIVLINLNRLSWEMMILPGSVLLLALSLRFLELRE